MSFLQAYLVGALAVTGLLVTWFRSDFPVQVFRLLQAAGWRRQDLGFWPEDTRYWLRHEWETWSALRLWGPLGHLLNCPVCLSWHLALWTALALAGATGQPWTFGFAIPGWVAVAHLLFGLSTKSYE